MLRAVPMVVTFLFYFIFNVISLPVDFILRLLEVFSGSDDAEL